MVEVCRAHGLPGPEFMINSGFVIMVFSKFEYAGPIKSDP